MTSSKRFLDVSCELLRPSRFQPRSVFDAEALWELALSIQENGIIDEPIVFAITPEGEVHASGRQPPFYELIAGERRVRAAMAVAWARLDEEMELRPAVLRLVEDGFYPLPARALQLLGKGGHRIHCRLQAGVDLGVLQRVIVVEGMQRANLSPMEEGRALLGLQEAHAWSQRRLAQEIGKSQPFVQQRLALLGLVEEAAGAMAAGEITATHARAISRVPLAMQPAVATWTAKAVRRDDSPVTTRQVEKAAADLARFVDPARWNPNAETVYLPVERNRLALMRWAVEGADLAACTPGLLRLRELAGYEGGNLLGKKARSIVKDKRLMQRALDALGQGGDLEASWGRFAGETLRDCEHCQFGERPGVAEAGIDAHCRRWQVPDGESVVTTTCQGFIGPADPVIIPLNFTPKSWFVRCGIAVEEEPFAHVTDMEEYVRGYGLAVEAQARERGERKLERESEHLVAIQRFMDWQTGLGAECLRHPQAHACGKCAYFLPKWDGEGPPCHFAVTEPLPKSYGEGHEAPAFGVLVARDGRTLPRCEQFAYQVTPSLHERPGMCFVDRPQVMEWLRALGSGRNDWHRNVVFGILGWLDYGRPVGKETDWERLTKWILNNWDELGGDAAMPTLLDVVLSEGGARGRGRGETVGLVNPMTGGEERWMPVQLEYVTGEREFESWGVWPEGWVRPWEGEGTDDREVTDGGTDDRGTTDDGGTDGEEDN